MKRIYPMTNARTGRTTYAVWEGERDKRNQQRLVRPRLLGVYSKRSAAAGERQQEGK